MNDIPFYQSKVVGRKKPSVKKLKPKAPKPKNPQTFRGKTKPGLFK